MDRDEGEVHAQAGSKEDWSGINAMHVLGCQCEDTDKTVHGAACMSTWAGPGPGPSSMRVTLLLVVSPIS